MSDVCYVCRLQYFLLLFYHSFLSGDPLKAVFFCMHSPKLVKNGNYTLKCTQHNHKEHLFTICNNYTLYRRLSENAIFTHLCILSIRVLYYCKSIKLYIPMLCT